MKNILSNCRYMKIRMLLQKLFQTICSLQLTSVLNHDCLVRHILIMINDTLICLSQSLVEIGNIQVSLFNIQDRRNQWLTLQILAGIEAKPFSRKYIWSHKDWPIKKMTTFEFGHFTTIFGHFFANYIYIFHKTEVLMVILRG